MNFPSAMFAGRFSSSCGHLGIDIGSRSIKMLQLRRQGSHLAVVGAAEVPLWSDRGPAKAEPPNTSPTEGSALAPEDVTASSAGSPAPLSLGRGSAAPISSLSERLRVAFTSGGFTGRKCVVSLPRSDLFVQAIRLPKMPEPELRQAARWEAAERFGLDPEACEVDIVRTGSSGSGTPGIAGAGATHPPGVDLGSGREEVLVIAAAHAVIHARLKPLLEAGLRPLAVDAHFCALARVFSRQFRRESDRQHVRVVLEVGASGSTVLILRGSEIAFCKPINIGGREFNQAVAEHLQLDVASAAELRAARSLSACGSARAELDAGTAESPNEESGGGSADPATDRAIFEATRPLLGELAKDVSLCLRYYGVTFRGKPAYQIILTGGECLEPHLGSLLRSACKLPVVFDDEPETLARLLPGIGSIMHRTPGPAPQWAVAAGLSIRNLDEAVVRLEDRCDVRGNGTETEIRGQRSEVRSQKSEVRSPAPEVLGRGQTSEVGTGILTSDRRPPTSERPLGRKEAA